MTTNNFVSLVARTAGGAGLFFAGLSYFAQVPEPNFIRGVGLLTAGIAFLVLALTTGVKDIRRS